MTQITGFLQNYYKFSLVLMLLVLSACASQRPPVLIPFDDGEYWVLGDDLVFTIRETGQRIVVPRGFVTDFASVPRVFWSFFPKHGVYSRAAIVHDFLYWQQQCTREQADELFDIVMEDSDVDTTSRLTIYAAVRVWGDDAWEANAEAKEAGYIRVIPERYLNFPVKTHWEDYREFLRKMLDDNERVEEFPVGTPPPYCEALQQKEAAPGETQPDAREPDSGEEPAEDQDQPTVPENLPVPESAIGA